MDRYTLVFEPNNLVCQCMHLQMYVHMHLHVFACMCVSVFAHAYKTFTMKRTSNTYCNILNIFISIIYMYIYINK